MRALVCPGQGSQKKSFLSPWLEIDGVREHLQRLSDAAGIDLIHYGTEAEEETIKDTAIAQPLIVAAGIVTGRKVLQKLGESKLILAGHSVGEITAAALAGEARARATLDHFSAFLATVAADLVLTLGARGGVYLCGGILPRVADYFINQSPFNARFADKGRFAAYLDAVPVWLVTAENPGLLGAAEALQG